MPRGIDLIADGGDMTVNLAYSLESCRSDGTSSSTSFSCRISRAAFLTTSQTCARPSVVAELQASYDVHFGVISYVDLPFGDFGYSGEWPYRLESAVRG